MQSISKERVQALMRREPQPVLIEVLPYGDYRAYHLPHAVNAPVEDIAFDAKVQEFAPDKSEPVIVYCRNAACGASPHAARRLEELGYERVYDYAAGKEDWKAAGLPVE